MSYQGTYRLWVAPMLLVFLASPLGGCDEEKGELGALCRVSADCVSGFCKDMVCTDKAQTIDSCNRDLFEPNDEQSQAATIGVGTYSGLTICPASDRDYYKFTLPEPSEIHVKVTLMDGSLPNTVQLLSEDGDAHELEEENNTGKGVTLSASLPAGDHFILVQGSSEGIYQLQLLPKESCPNTDDNTSIEDAAIVESNGEGVEGFVCPGLVHYFKLDGHPMEDVRVDIGRLYPEQQEIGSQIGATLLQPDAVELSEVTMEDGEDGKLELRYGGGLDAGPIYLSLRPLGNSPVPFRLDAAWCTNDPHEPENNHPATAMVLAAGGELEAALCANDVDYTQIEVLPNSRLNVEVEFQQPVAEGVEATLEALVWEDPAIEDENTMVSITQMLVTEEWAQIQIPPQDRQQPIFLRLTAGESSMGPYTIRFDEMVDCSVDPDIVDRSDIETTPLSFPMQGREGNPAILEHQVCSGIPQFFRFPGLQAGDRTVVMAFFGQAPAGTELKAILPGATLPIDGSDTVQDGQAMLDIIATAPGELQVEIATPSSDENFFIPYDLTVRRGPSVCETGGSSSDNPTPVANLPHQSTLCAFHPLWLKISFEPTGDHPDLDLRLTHDEEHGIVAMYINGADGEFPLLAEGVETTPGVIEVSLPGAGQGEYLINLSLSAGYQLDYQLEYQLPAN